MKKVLVCVLALSCFGGAALAQPTNGPPNPGESGVFRAHIEEGVGCLLFVDGNTALSALVCADNSLAGCVEATEFTPLEIQNVVITDEVFTQLLFADNLFTTVYDDTGFPPFDCAFFLNETDRLLALGMTSLIITDNDVANAGRRSNSFGNNIQGELFLFPDGGTTHLNAAFRGVILPNGTFNVPVNSVNLRPDPR